MTHQAQSSDTTSEHFHVPSGTFQRGTEINTKYCEEKNLQNPTINFSQNKSEGWGQMPVSPKKKG
jgi:hypothetical protein